MALTWLWFSPILGAFAVLALGKIGKSEGLARFAALLVSLGVLFLCGALAYDLRTTGLPLLDEFLGGVGYGVTYHFSADSLSAALCFLNAFLTVISIAASWKQDVSSGYWAAFLFLEGALMGVFLAADLFFFYVFWEAVLIPMFFIIGLWGSSGRRHAAVKFFLFTFSGSVLMLLGILLWVTKAHELTGLWSWDIGFLRQHVGFGRSALFVFVSLLIGFGVKVPIVPLHTWLPDAHTEAPAAGSVMLAGVLLKMGVYGFLRVLLPAFPVLCREALPALGALAVINIVYGSLAAFVQADLKRLIAYSSVAHLGFCLLGIFSLTAEGLSGGTLQLVNHGLTTGALFLMVGFLYERTHKRGVADFGSLAATAPVLSLFFTISVLASIGVPGLNGFVGEFLSVAGMLRVSPALAMTGLSGIVLSAAYLLPAYATVFWGERSASSASYEVLDLNRRERGILWVLTLSMLAIGFWPKPWLNFLEPALRGLVR